MTSLAVSHYSTNDSKPQEQKCTDSARRFAYLKRDHSPQMAKTQQLNRGELNEKNLTTLVIGKHTTSLHTVVDIVL